MYHTVAFLQNQWFRQPDRVAQTYAKYKAMGKAPEVLDRAFLFMGCTTGIRIKRAFGEELVDSIVWANASPKIAAKSDGCFPADPAHIADVLARYDPVECILGFGRVAGDALSRLYPKARESGCLIIGPHPAARHEFVMDELVQMAAEIRQFRERLKR